MKRLWTFLSQLKRLKRPHRSYLRQLKIFPNVVTKEVVMQKVLSDPIVTDVVPNPNGASKDTIFFIEKEVVFDIVQSLSKVKRTTSSTKLATKHAILIALVNASSITKHSNKKLDY